MFWLDVFRLQAGFEALVEASFSYGFWLNTGWVDSFVSLLRLQQVCCCELVMALQV